MSRTTRVLAGAVIRTGSEVYFNGREASVPPQITLTPEGYEKLCQGYFCHRCLSDTEEAFSCPNVTYFCQGFTPESLRQWLEIEFRGEESLWPDRSDEIEDARERDFWTPELGILVPRDLE